MLLTRVLGGLAVLATTALVVSGCDILQEFIEPCHARDRFLLSNSGGSFAETDTHLDGDYKLATIDGKPIPATGYPLPGRTDGKRLLSGRLHFNTTSTEYSGKCDKLLRSSGSVLAYYQTTTTNGQTKDDTYRGGTFKRDHENNTSEMGAFGYSAPLTVELPYGNVKSITLVALIGEFGIGITYTLKFTR